MTNSMRAILAMPILAMCCGAAALWTTPARGAEWKVEPSMHLPEVEQVASPTVATVAHNDFETSTKPWKPKSKAIALTAVPDGHESKGAMRVKGTQPDGWNFAWSPKFSVEQGKAYRASLWVKRNAAPSPATPMAFKVEFFNKPPKKGSRSLSKSIPVDDIGTWRQLAVEFRPPEGCEAVAIALEKGVNTPVAIDATVDDFRLDQIEALSASASLKGMKLVGPITDTLVGVHPRIYMDAAKLERLRKETKTNPKWKPAVKTLLQIADRGVRSGPPDYDERLKNFDKKRGSNEQLWQRGVGNIIPEMAMAYLLTGEKKYLDATKAWVFASLDYPTWGLEKTDGMDLAAGHQFAGIGLAYDWLYHDLTPAERQTIREKLVPRGNAMTTGAATGRAWWRNSYMQNHQWVSVGGLATSAFAICDEEPVANSWIHLAHQKFVKTLDTVGDDGASHEGYGYWQYGAEYIMRYMEMARDLLGVDLYYSGGAPHPWLKKNALYALHLATPMDYWKRNKCAIDLGDCPRYNWYGPSYLLRNAARRFAGSPEARLAQWLAAQMEAKGVDATSSGHYLNLVWFDPSLPEMPETEFPTMHRFPDLDIVSARSAWKGPAVQLVVKCGPPLGHKHVNAKRGYGAGHVHPDCGHFTLVVGGDFVFRDDGYAHPKTTAWHNAMLIDGKGQKGGGRWFQFGEWISDRGDPRILEATSTPKVDTIVCDPTEAYPKALGLEKWVRRYEFHKPDRIVIADDVTMKQPGELEWRAFCEGALTKTGEGRFRTVSGRTTADVTVESGDPISTEKIQVATGRHEGKKHDCLSIKTKGKATKAHVTTVIQLTIAAP